MSSSRVAGISEEDINRLVELRHRLHSIAEVSGKEAKTVDYVQAFLKDTGPDKLRSGIGGHGLVATYKGEEEGPSVLIRCELDALPIPDENDVEYASETEGVGHKCGHDGHMAILCGAALQLKKQKPGRGRVHLLFQPAEETGQGAGRMLEDDGFSGINPDYVCALHNLPGYKKHQIVVRPGVFAAASTGFIARFKGATSHAAHPEEGRSPALAMAQLVEALSAVPQYYSALDQSAKVTVIHATLGERAFGTSPGKAQVMATLRTYDNDLLDMLKTKAEAIAKGLAQTYELEVETEWVESFSVTSNDEGVTETIREAARLLELDVFEKPEPFSWSEDFGQFTQAYTGAMFGLGAGKEQPALHASGYDFPDEIIETGVNMFMSIIEQLTMSN